MVTKRPTLCAGSTFQPVSEQDLHAAAAQLHAGFRPEQLAELELALQAHFKAPSFAALGHGASLLQCCSDDTVMLKIISDFSPSAPLNKVATSPCPVFSCTSALCLIGLLADPV